MDRRLTAILAADIVGYSAMIRADEIGTLTAFRALRDTVLAPGLEQHRGRVVKYMGDGFLAEFASVLDAVSCAAALQQAIAARNADQAAPLVFRMGVNLGDVVIEGDDIHGDGVNIAARLEAIAAPGGVCVSGGVYEQVRDRLDLAFASKGPQALKNIDRAVDVWEWTAQQVGAVRQTPATALRDKPAIAVLPFDNMSGDPEQVYFADGIAEDVITALSRSRELLVIARNSSFSYRGQSVDVRQVGRDLGVRYVVEGSVRRAGNRVRITAQLIDAGTGNHIWADRYDRPLEDIFEVQDEITVNISGAVGSEIRETETTRARASAPSDLDAWESLLRAAWHVDQLTEAGMAEGVAIAEQVARKYDDNSDAYSIIARARGWQSIYGWGDLPSSETIALSIEAARKAIDRDVRNDAAHAALAGAYWLNGEHDAAIRSGERAIALNPNSFFGRAWLACALCWGGPETRPRAIEQADVMKQLMPAGLLASFAPCGHAMSALFDARYPDAVRFARDALQHHPRYGLAHRVLASALGLSGQIDAAQAAWAEAIRVQPLDMAVYLVSFHRVCRERSDAERYIEGMRLAGADIPD